MANSKRSAVQSVESLKKETKFLTTSPKNCTEVIRCAVLTKSPLKPSKTGKMFTMRFCDSNPSVNTRCVCFDPSKFDELQAKKTYEIHNYKVKKGFGAYNNLEIVIDDNTTIKNSAQQFIIEGSTFTISQILRGETENVNFINVKAKVVNLEDVKTVGRYPDIKEKRDVTLADQTGHINLVLWRQAARNIDFGIGDVLSIENATVSKFNHAFNLSANYDTHIVKMEDQTMEIATSVPVLPKKPTMVTSVQESVTGYKDFKSLMRCVTCKTQIELTDKNIFKQTSAGYILKCPTCSTTFLRKPSDTINESKFLINNNWYTGRGIVVQHLFAMPHAAKTPSEEQILLLIGSKFSLRINVGEKKIEHAIPLDPEVDEIFRAHFSTDISDEYLALTADSPKKPKED